MSKLSQIENALSAIDQAKFHSLCDSYLHLKGYEGVNPLGRVIGADKVRPGTPDTYITQPDGMFIFAEDSTQQEGLANKFEGDLDKCFDEAKTGIPVGQIREVVLCHNSILKPEEQNRLEELCVSKGVRPSVLGLGPIAQDLYHKYPGLARDFLGIQVDTGQIVSPEEFVGTYNKRAFATPLDTTFRFREKELAQLISGLEQSDLVVISGPAGVGKSRLALECCRSFSDRHPEFEVSCIDNRGANIHEDLQVRFKRPGKNLLMVDDANRLSGFTYALHLLLDQTEERKIKIIATVRDYALGAVLQASRPLGEPVLVKLPALKDEQIKELVREEYEIKNSLYLERISDIAKGSPRLAVMAARLAVHENTLASIADVSNLYEQYFGSITDDLRDLRDAKLLQVAGIISFFQTVDRSNSELVGAICDAFDLTPDELWQGARRLHELEMVDMYENEIVKISDQVLSTYLFYLSAFREKAVDFGIILEHFFPRFRQRVVDALNPVLDAFDARKITHDIRPTVDRVWRLLQQRGDQDVLRQLMEVFWFAQQTKVLVYVKEEIHRLPIDPQPVESIQFSASPDKEAPWLVGILGLFRYGDEVSRRNALTLLLDYLEKRPVDFPSVLKTLVEQYGMKLQSYLQDFVVERETADLVWDRAHRGGNEAFSRLFLAVAEPLLHTHFQTNEMKGESLVLTRFDVPVSPALFEFRRTLWQRVFSLASLPSLRDSVLNLIKNHSHAGYEVANAEILAKDAPSVLSFFRSNLDPSDYRHCVIVHDYLELLSFRGVAGDEDLGSLFNNELYAISELLLDDRAARREIGRKEYEKQKAERLAARTRQLDAAGFDVFLGQCAEVLCVESDGPSEYQIQNSVGGLLAKLAERDRALYETVLHRYLQAGNRLRLGPWTLVDKLVQGSGPDRAYEIISQADYVGCKSWLFRYFTAIPATSATSEHLEKLYELYATSSAQDLPRDFDFLLKFLPVDADVVLRVTRGLVAKAVADAGIGSALCGLFDSQSQIGGKLSEIFAGNLGLLKQAYLAACTADRHMDYDGHGFGKLLDLDPAFAGEWVTWMFSRKDWVSRYDDSRDYSFIWHRHDHAAVIEAIVERVQIEGKKRSHSYSYIEVFFTNRGGQEDAQTLRERQDAFLDRIIDSRHAEGEIMQLLFNVIADFSQDRRRARIQNFLRRNRDFDAFAALPLEPSSGGWTGSAVPWYQQRVDWYESLLPLLEDVDLLRHRQLVEHAIQDLRNSIEREKKRDFMGH